MTDETPTPDPIPTAQPSADSNPDAGSAAQNTGTGDAWNEVVARMGDLGQALSAWAKSAADDPANKARLDSVRSGVDEMARQAGDAFGKVASTDFGQQVSQGAQQAGDAIGGAAQQVSDAAAPHVATALSGLAGFFGSAAAKMDEAVNRDRSADKSADKDATPAPPVPVEAPVTEPSTEPPSQPTVGPDSES